MHKYELAHIIECEGKKDEEIQSVIGQVRTLIGDLGGRIVKEEVWGQKELAYEINKQNHGFYMFTIMTLEPNKMIEFEKKMRLIDGSMRYLLINLDNEPGYNMEQQTEAMEKSTKEAKEKEEKIETKIEVEETIKPAKAEKKSPKTHEEETKEEKEEKVKTEVKDADEKEEKEEKEEKTEAKESKKEVAPKKDEKSKEKSKEEIDKLIDEKLNEIL